MTAMNHRKNLGNEMPVGEYASRKFWLLLGLTMIQGCTLGFVELPGEFHVFRASRDEVLITRKISHQGEPMVPAKVFEMWWNNEMIAAKVHPLVRRSPNSKNETSMIGDSNVIDFWIIDVPRNKQFGPLSENDFQKRLIEFGVQPKSVSFRSPPFTRRVD